jgi:hypothetical protein
MNYVTYVCKWKMIAAETIPGMWERIKENVEGMNSSMICLIYCKNFCK